MNPSAGQKLSLTNLVELFLKIATASLGIMYMLGLLITNAQLMALGIADFSSVLRIRNIMTGGAFVIYLVFFLAFCCAASMMLGAGLYIFRAEKPFWKKVVAFVTITILILAVEYLIIDFGGKAIGCMLPWGRPWESGERFGGYKQFVYSYGRTKVFGAGFLVVLACVPFTYLLFRRVMLFFSESDNSEEDFPSGDRLLKAPMVRAMFGWNIVLALLLGMPLLLFDYADGLYPNIRYNFGGGQPRIVRLDTETRDVSLIELLGADTYADLGDRGKAVLTRPLALWHQDEGFFYVSPLFSVGQGFSKVIALDGKAVHTIYYQPGYIKIGSGGHILDTCLGEVTIEGTQPSDQ